jgi:hypothetical protein
MFSQPGHHACHAEPGEWRLPLHRSQHKGVHQHQVPVPGQRCRLALHAGRWAVGPYLSPDLGSDGLAFTYAANDPLPFSTADPISHSPDATAQCTAHIVTHCCSVGFAYIATQPDTHRSPEQTADSQPVVSADRTPDYCHSNCTPHEHQPSFSRTERPAYPEANIVADQVADACAQQTANP